MTDIHLIGTRPHPNGPHLWRYLTGPENVWAHSPVGHKPSSRTRGKTTNPRRPTRRLCKCRDLGEGKSHHPAPRRPFLGQPWPSGGMSGGDSGPGSDWARSTSAGYQSSVRPSSRTISALTTDHPPDTTIDGTVRLRLLCAAVAAAVGEREVILRAGRSFLPSSDASALWRWRAGQRET